MFQRKLPVMDNCQSLVIQTLDVTQRFLSKQNLIQLLFSAYHNLISKQIY